MSMLNDGETGPYKTKKHSVSNVLSTGETISIRIKIAVHRIRSTYRVNCSDAPGDAPLGIFRLC